MHVVPYHQRLGRVISSSAISLGFATTTVCFQYLYRTLLLQLRVVCVLNGSFCINVL